MWSAAGLVPVVLRSTPEFLERVWNNGIAGEKRSSSGKQASDGPKVLLLHVGDTGDVAVISSSL